MSSLEETKEDVQLYFSVLLHSPSQYAETQYSRLSVSLLCVFWGYVLLIIVSGFYHCHRVRSKVRENENKSAQTEEQMEEMNHQEYGIDSSSIWCPSPSSVSIQTSSDSDD